MGPSSPQKGHCSPQFLAHVYSGQTAGSIKMPLGKEVVLGPGNIVLDGDPAALHECDTAAPSLFYCGQTVAHLSYCWALVSFLTCILYNHASSVQVECWIKSAESEAVWKKNVVCRREIDSACMCLCACSFDVYWLCRYDHLRKEASDVKPLEKVDGIAEPWRAALESSFTKYVQNYYKELGSITVYGTSTAEGNITLTACIESHQFSPKNFW